MTAEAAFIDFVGRVEPRLRAALVAHYGAERGREATAEALAWAWEHWSDMERIVHPVPYLYRVGQSRSRSRLTPPMTPEPGRADPPWVEPALPAALDRLSRKQRMAVVLVHAMGWTQAEAGEVMRVRTGTVKTHIERGLAKLRSALEVDADA